MLQSPKKTMLLKALTNINIRLRKKREEEENEGRELKDSNAT